MTVSMRRKAFVVALSLLLALVAPPAWAADEEEARDGGDAAASEPSADAPPVEAAPAEAPPVEAKPVKSKPVKTKPVKAKPARVVGKVVDTDGKPLAGVQVMLGRQDTTTRNGGDFSFKSLPGKYTVTVKSGENKETFKGVEVEGGEMKPEFFQVEWEGE